ncbi:MAG: type II toxin-antitoxin system HicA family toxin [Elusimicrobia bacterium]|nr:type II toxin-antitoxin system HicA family toxin [Elusimicrobiota bacterium]
MPKLGPVSWRELVQKLKSFGFEGPFSGGRHLYMTKDDLTLTIPNPHHGDIGPDLLHRLLRQAAISRNDWIEQ